MWIKRLVLFICLVVHSLSFATDKKIVSVLTIHNSGKGVFQDNRRDFGVITAIAFELEASTQTALGDPLSEIFVYQFELPGNLTSFPNG